MKDQYDVAVVGAGIGGSALAATLANAGLDVVVLEAQQDYHDRIRGETVMPWGVREVKRLGLEQVLLDAGGEYADTFVLYDCTRDPAEAEANALPLSLLAPDVEGSLNVGHPEASRALSAHASAVGATVCRGVEDVQIAGGTNPTVTWTNGHGPSEVRCRMIVGADGRASTVRRQLGIGLIERPAGTYGSGLLVRTDKNLLRGDVIGAAEEAMFLAFPRSNGLTRLYLWVDGRRQKEFTGPQKLEHFLASFPSQAFPASADLVAGEVAGPCGGAPSTDTWTDDPPVADGVVLIGDAAGWSDPIIGQGLSIALRDARTVAEVLTASDDWTPSAFGDYVSERQERMRRLRVASRISTVMRCTFTDEGRQRRVRWMSALTSDPVLLAQTTCPISGPENAPPEVFTDEALTSTISM
jgi:2-polyprenyl-6-methoxyphenol hydroxylase-like FAD-dependent oxidoreductase